MSELETPVSAHLALIWNKHAATVLERVACLVKVQALIRELSPDERGAAEQAAHKLAGTLGTFGSPQGSQIASQIDCVFSAETVLDERAAADVSELISALKESVEQLAKSYESRPA